MPTAVLDVLDAYRTDLSAASRSGPFGERDQTWMLFGTVLQQAVALPTEARAEYLGPALEKIAATNLESESSTNAVAGLVESISEEADDAGASSLALVLLELGRTLVPLDDVRHQGRFMARQARVHRKLGEMDVALRLYDDVEQWGLRQGDEELACRGRLGKGIVARMRGNYPEARAHFDWLLERTNGKPDLLDVKLNAHHGMMIAAAVANDFETALYHGWTGYDAAGHDPVKQAEMLMMVANVCRLLGQARAALNGYLLTLSRPIPRRLRMTTIGSAVLAAASLGDRAVVERLATEGVALIDVSPDQYENADLERELAEAFFSLGEHQRADGFKRRCVDRAKANGFFEIMLNAEVLGPATTMSKPADPELSDGVRSATRRLLKEDSNDLLEAALNPSG